MLVQAVIAQGEPANVEDVVEFVRDQVQPLVDDRPGSRGVALWCNAGAGVVVLLTAWEDVGALQDSDSDLAEVADQVSGLLEANQHRVEVLESLVMFQRHPDEPGHWTRLTETSSPVERTEENIALFTSEVLPAIRRITGTNSIYLLVNRDRGHAISAVTYTSRETLNGSRARAARLREESIERLGAEVTNVLEVEVVIVGIRPPVDLPDQGRPVEFRSSAST
jgi:hypothetical protein